MTVEASARRQTKYLQAGSGFLSQHSKELFFGVGRGQESVRATVRWPSGLVQTFAGLPVNQRIEIEEGSEKFVARAFATSPASYLHAGDVAKTPALPSTAETWLIEPLSAPEFSLPDFAGKMRELRSYRGSGASLLLGGGFASLQEEIALLQKHGQELRRAVWQFWGSSGRSGDAAKAQALAGEYGAAFTTVFGTEETAGVYNIIYRYLFDRRRDLGFPTFARRCRRKDRQGVSGRSETGAAGGGCKVDAPNTGRAHEQSAAV